ncbi:hypothetical protein EV421DRAFT_1910377 [Armillaria borealis]|uniref:Uncharacterized protein n=1 Tax=Armillaria borealis TaxID=47425 RepID=A0AA39J072_9AGAR|nr:hypothetical protein EV421DRAFT_1910377 [Armillaria borealis]
MANNNHHDTFLGVDSSHNNGVYTFSDNAWTSHAVSGPTALAVSALMFIPHPESFSDTYIFADSARRQTALLAFDNQYTPSPPIQRSQLSVFPDALSPSSQLNEQTTGTPFSFESVFGSYYELYATSASALSIEGPERKVLQELHLVDADDGGADRKRVRWNTEVAEFTIELCKKVKMLELPMRTSQVAPVLIMDYDGVSLDDNSDEENNNEGDGTGTGTRAIVAGNVERDRELEDYIFKEGNQILRSMISYP